MTSLAKPLLATTALASRGLCVNCDNGVDCGFYTGPGPVIHCEEWRTETRPSVVEPPLYRDLGCGDPTDRRTPYLGICINCDERETFRLRKAQVPVWHCEEYR